MIVFLKEKADQIIKKNITYLIKRKLNLNTDFVYDSFFQQLNLSQMNLLIREINEISFKLSEILKIIF